MKKKIYIAGKVTGVPVNEYIEKFQSAQNMLEKLGFKVTNPTKLISNPKCDWNQAMIICFKALEKCHAIYMMPCSIDSPGAQLELDYAIDLKLDIYYELE